jgi:Flp pilus assembly pilin Flp
MRNLSLKAISWAQSRKREEGQGIVEYALVLAVISLIVVTVLLTPINNGLKAVAADIETALTGS